MSGEWTIVADDLTTVLFDLDDATGANNPFGACTSFGLSGAFDPGRVGTELTQFASSSRPGGITVYRRDPLTQASWRQRVWGTDDIQVSEAIGYLGQLLSRGGIIKIFPTQRAYAKYLYFEPSEAPGSLEGNDYELQYLFQHFDTPLGVQIKLWRQPDFRWDELNPNVQLLSNSTLMMLDVDDSNPVGYTWDDNDHINTQDVDWTVPAFTWSMDTDDLKSLRATAVDGIVGDIYSGSCDMAAALSNARFFIRIKFFDSGSAVLRTDESDQWILSPLMKRYTYASEAAPASTDTVQMQIVMNNSTADEVRVWSRYWQLEVGSVSTPYRMGEETINNDPSRNRGRAIPVFIQGDYPTPVRVKYGVVSDSSLTTFQVAKRSDEGVAGYRAVTELLNNSRLFRCADGTLYDDTDTVSDGACSQDEGIVVDFGDVEATVRRARITKNIVLESWRGELDLILRTKPMGDSKYEVGAAVGFAGSDPATFDLPTIILDATDSSGSDVKYGRYLLGTFRVPDSTIRSLSGMFTPSVLSVSIDLIVGRLSGNDDFRADYIELFPADDTSYQATMRRLASGFRFWTGPQLITPPDEPGGLNAGNRGGNYMQLDDEDDAWATEQMALKTGHHVFQVDNSTYQPDGDGGEVGVLVIRDITDHSDVTTVSLKGVDGKTWVRGITKVEFDSTPAHVYELQGRNTSGFLIDTWSVSYGFSEFIAQDQFIESYPEDFLVLHKSASGAPLDYLAPGGATPIIMDPGLNLLFGAVGQIVPTGLLMPEDDIDDQGSLSITYQPRWRTP